MEWMERYRTFKTQVLFRLEMMKNIIVVQKLFRSMISRIFIKGV